MFDRIIRIGHLQACNVEIKAIAVIPSVG